MRPPRHKVIISICPGWFLIVECERRWMSQTIEQIRENKMKLNLPPKLILSQHEAKQLNALVSDAIHHRGLCQCFICHRNVRKGLIAGYGDIFRSPNPV